jgi:SAM-dependent methyltransferase
MSMKYNPMGLILCVSLLLSLSVSGEAVGGETVKQATDASKEKRVSRYDATARGINAPMYTYYAGKIKERTGITKGVCLDVGSGGGYLGLSLAKITDLDFIFLDISPRALEKAEQHIVEDGLQARAKTLLADVHSIPLPDGSVSLVISRGSIPFWKDPVKALKEIYRVLAPGGKTYVGVGRGTPEIRAQIDARRKELGMKPSAWPGPGKRHDSAGKAPGRRWNLNLDETMKETGITRYVIYNGEDGKWIQMWK